MFLRLMVLLLALRTAAADLPAFDLSDPTTAAQWKPAHDVSLRATNGALHVGITGTDPYFIGPARNYPTDLPLWMIVEGRSDSAGSAQVFWAGRLPESEERSVRFFMPGNTNAVLRIPIPPIGPGTRLRVDPPGFSGSFTLRSLRFEPRPTLTLPTWAPAHAASMTGITATLRAGPLTLRHAATGPGAFVIDINGRPFAIGHTQAPIGYQRDGTTRWFDLGSPLAPGPRFKRSPRSVEIQSRHRDPDGAVWTFDQTFDVDGEHLRHRSRIRVDQDRNVVFAPALLVLPGAGSFGTRKSQGLLAGVEYLADEESSSERDLIGAQARRQVVDPLKLTFPLMAIAAEGNWLSLSWNPGAAASLPLAPLHDSPDRITGSGGHLFGILHPGARPEVREDGSLLPYAGHPLKAGVALEAESFLTAGSGNTVVHALQSHIRRAGLPPLPKPVTSAQEYYRLAARGWLDSGIREGARYRHAVGNGFHPSPAPDAGYFESWLSHRITDPALAERLTLAARENAATIPDNAWMQGLIGHIRFPSPALVALKAPATARTSVSLARQHLDALGPETRLHYRAPSPAQDLGRTHWTNHANGLTATHLSQAFDHALLSGDATLVDECLVHLRRMSQYDDEVPRGAQTWEVPLHTPDILASAYLVKVYVLGYELTGDRLFLERARYWAWTGVPFVYLASPVEGPVGVYSTTPVLGATQFIAPNWIGLPVQWCGLVYAEALLRLAAHDRSLNWTRLAHGIALAGVQHVHPESDGPAMGCLPDSFDLRAQSRNPVPINPGTLLPLAAIAYGERSLHGFAAAHTPRVWISAAGPAQTILAEPSRVRFRIQLPRDETSHVIVGSTRAPSTLLWKGQPIEREADPEAPASRTVLRLSGDGELELRFP
jgi:hypothetical protein